MSPQSVHLIRMQYKTETGKSSEFTVFEGDEYENQDVIDYIEWLEEKVRLFNEVEQK